MDYENSREYLRNEIAKLNQLQDHEEGFELCKKFIIDIAKANNLEVIIIKDSYYIKKGPDPKAILHLNLDSKALCKELSLIDDNQIVADDNIYIMDSILVIAFLIENSYNSFDILLTSNNIQNDNKSYASLTEVIRTENVINLNLRQARCLADEFSALTLSKVKVAVERIEVDYNTKSFRLAVSNLIGGHTSEDLDKVRLNSLKTIISLIRKIKSKVDLHVVRFVGGDRYDVIPSSAIIDFVVNEEYENDLYDIFNLVKNESIEKNLKYEPDMDISLTEEEQISLNPITDTSFSRLSSFVELIPSGAYAVDSNSNQLISSINLSTARTVDDYVSFIVCYRSLTADGMDDMLSKAEQAAQISNSEIISELQIPKWENTDHTLSEIFSETFKNLTGEDLNIIKTQYSLDSSIIFNKLNVKMVSLGVKYKQGDDNKYYSNIDDIIIVADILENVLSRLSTM